MASTGVRERGGRARLGLMAGMVLMAAAWQGTTLIVTKKESKLRSTAKVFAPAVADVREGDKLALVASKGAWRQVTYRGQTGWIHETDVTDRKEVRLSGEGVREKYSVEEKSAARKGFNPQVEREYRNQKPDLARAFDLVDRIQSRKVPEADVEAFLREGGLLRDSTGGKQ